MPTATATGRCSGSRSLGAVLANLVNNLPATLILLAAIPTGATAPLLALLVGVNIGPNVTYTGSLATLLWRREVRESGVEPPRRAFYRFGVPRDAAGAAARGHRALADPPGRLTCSFPCELHALWHGAARTETGSRGGGGSWRRRRCSPDASPRFARCSAICSTEMIAMRCSCANSSRYGRRAGEPSSWSTSQITATGGEPGEPGEVDRGLGVAAPLEHAARRGPAAGTRDRAG